jgi:hypothetical protein
MILSLINADVHCRVFHRRSTMSVRVLASACLIVLALLVQPVAAQTVYKSTMPDGSVVFSDQPQPDAAKVESSTPDTSDTGVQVLQPGAAEKLQQMEAERKQGESSGDGQRQAEEALRNAEAALANGKDPLPGERIGTAGGASRLTDNYWARQKKLEQNVVDARKRANAR